MGLLSVKEGSYMASQVEHNMRYYVCGGSPRTGETKVGTQQNIRSSAPVSPVTLIIP